MAALILIFLTGCNLVANLTPAETLRDVPVPTPPLPQADANAVMEGICFAAARDAAGRFFVLRSADELSNFFDLADNSRLCRQPVARQTHDFTGGRVLAGLWSAGRGCAATHQIIRWQRNDAARQIHLQLRLEVSGDCDYELLQPWWMTLDDAREHDVVIELLP